MLTAPVSRLCCQSFAGGPLPRIYDHLQNSPGRFDPNDLN